MKIRKAAHDEVTVSLDELKPGDTFRYPDDDTIYMALDQDDVEAIIEQADGVKNEDEPESLFFIRPDKGSLHDAPATDRVIPVLAEIVLL